MDIPNIRPGAPQEVPEAGSAKKGEQSAELTQLPTRGGEPVSRSEILENCARLKEGHLPEKLQKVVAAVTEAKGAISTGPFETGRANAAVLSAVFRSLSEKE